MDPHVSNLLLMSGIVLVIGRLIPGVKLENIVSAIIVGWLIGLSSPQVVMGLEALELAPGLVAFCSIVANGLLVMVFASFVPGFTVDHFRAALLFYMAASFLHLMLTHLIIS